jgi:hypothetical protein
VIAGNKILVGGVDGAKLGRRVSFRLALRAQPVDAAPSHQLICQYFPEETICLADLAKTELE